MLRIYLDQKDWIALLKAAADRPERASHADALTLLRAGVDAGAVSLPLSHVHYQETSHRRPYAKRLPLASLMAELSRFHAIAPFYKLAKDEMRHFIATHFDAPIGVPDPPQPFGRGGDHAFGYGVIAESLEGLKAKFRPFATGVDQAVDELSDILELGLLTGDRGAQRPYIAHVVLGPRLVRRLFLQSGELVVAVHARDVLDEPCDRGRVPWHLLYADVGERGEYVILLLVVGGRVLRPVGQLTRRRSMPKADLSSLFTPGGLGGLKPP